jgi:hypothetical protein
MKLTVDEYCKKYEISKNILSSKIKAKKLNYIIENGEIYIIEPSQTIKKPKITASTVIELYKRENKALKEKIKLLEAKIDKLIDDKEQMLREERQRIEKLYESKDEQLKTILELINTKMKMEKQNIISSDYKPLKLENKYQNNLIELKEYLKTLDITPQERKILKKRFLELRGEDIRILQQNGKIYLDFSKFDYSDLLTI